MWNAIVFKWQGWQPARRNTIKGIAIFVAVVAFATGMALLEGGH